MLKRVERLKNIGGCHSYLAVWVCATLKVLVARNFELPNGRLVAGFAPVMTPV